MEYCKNLKVDETPDYTYLKELFTCGIISKEVSDNPLFDWEQVVIYHYIIG
jgi:hypothetical protein